MHISYVLESNSLANRSSFIIGHRQYGWFEAAAVCQHLASLAGTETRSTSYLCIWNRPSPSVIIGGTGRGNHKVAYLLQEKTCKSALPPRGDCAQVEAYFTVREVLSEASTAPDGALSRERSGFCWCRYSTLG